MLINIKFGWLAKLLKILFLAHDAGLISEKPGINIPNSTSTTFPNPENSNK